MIDVHVTKQDLQGHGACPGGLDLFSAHYPEGLRGSWEAVRGELIRSPLRKYLGWASCILGLPRSWVGVALTGADLTGADLRGADLTEALR